MKSFRRKPRRRPKTVVKPTAWVKCARILVALAFWGCGALQTTAQPPVLRVGTSGDYAPFSLAADGAGVASARGFDVDLARAFARDRGLRIEWVEFRWSELSRDMAAGRFDVVMSGVTVRPERQLLGEFTVAVVETGAVVLVAAGGATQVSDLDGPEHRVGVNAGGHLERVAARFLPRAGRVAFSENAAVREALAKGDVDAVVTDTLEAPHWMQGLPTVRALAPLTRDRKAYWVNPARPELARDLESWLLDRELRGDLEAWRRKWFGEGGSRRTATPLAALLDAMDARLSLMPAVAEFKRANGLPVRAIAREQAVLRKAHADVSRAARAEGRDPLSACGIRALYRAQIEAAVAIQESVLAAPPEPSPRFTPDLDRELRPAISRLGDRIARALVRLPPDLSADTIRVETERALRTPGLANDPKRRIASALGSLFAASPGEDATCADQ